MSMKANKNMQAQALKTMHSLNSELAHRNLIEKSLSNATMDEILNPIGKMDWPEKDKYAKELITILKTSKTEEEILERAQEALASVTP